MLQSSIQCRAKRTIAFETAGICHFEPKKFNYINTASGLMPLAIALNMTVSVLSEFTEEEQRNRTAAGMAANGRPDGIYFYPAV